MKPRRSPVLLLVSFFSASLLLSLTLRAEVRQFTDLSGRVLAGELVAVSGDSVTIKRENGQSFTLKAATFSAADQAYFKQGLAGKKNSPSKITPKDIRELPFCGTLQTVKLNPKLKGMFDELKLTKSDRIRIHGKKQHDSGTVDGRVVYHIGKLALFPPLERSGKITAKLPNAEDVRTHYVVLETGDTLITKKLELRENESLPWTLTQEGGNTVFKVGETVTVSAPTTQVTGAGFAATARWAGNEVDVSVTFDEP